jgi:CheY-like chemotaxis protein
MVTSTASSGQEALQYLQESMQTQDPISLVLIDVHMPGISGFDLARKIFETPEYSDLKRIILTSSGRRGDSALCRELGIAAYLAKPIIETELVEAIQAALASKVSDARPPLVTRHFLNESQRSLDILVAEDNVVNQRLAMKLLESRGHRTVLAEDGISAVDLTEQNSFDLVLMDVQMPEMDGLEATRRIRDRETGADIRLPIVAMTAYAMAGDREMCLEAGMDHDISKPLQPEELFRVIGAIIGEGEEMAATDGTGDRKFDEVFAQEDLLKRLDGDSDLLKELIGIFLEDCPKVLQEIREAVARGDAGSVERSAHHAKGSLGNLNAKKATEAAQQLEEMGRDSRLMDSKAALETLEIEVASLTERLVQVAGIEGDQ